MVIMGRISEAFFGCNQISPSVSLSLWKRLVHLHGLTIRKGALSFDKCDQNICLWLSSLSLSSLKFTSSHFSFFFLYLLDLSALNTTLYLLYSALTFLLCLVPTHHLVSLAAQLVIPDPKVENSHICGSDYRGCSNKVTVAKTTQTILCQTQYSGKLTNIFQWR